MNKAFQAHHSTITGLAKGWAGRGLEGTVAVPVHDKIQAHAQ